MLKVDDLGASRLTNRERLILLSASLSLVWSQSYAKPPSTIEVRAGEAHVSRQASNRACARHEAKSGGKGALLGGATGAVVGGAMMAGPLGAGIGLVAGHEIGRHWTRCGQLAKRRAAAREQVARNSGRHNKHS